MTNHMTNFNYELAAPQHLISLSTSSYIVSVQTKVWTATKQDRAISDEVTNNKGADTDAGRFTKNLLNGNAKHKAIVNYRQSMNNWLKRLTFDWAGDSRLLPSVRLERFNNEYQQHEAEFKRLVDEFCVAYPSMISDAAFKQGTMFNPTDYPDVDDVRGRFGVRLHLTSVPSNDFRSGGIASAIADDMREHYEREVKRIVEELQADAEEQLIAKVERLRNVCEEKDEEGRKRRPKIYESTVEGLRELCETMRDYDPVSSNTGLRDAVMSVLTAIDGTTTETLRESEYRRAEVKEDLDDVLSKFRPISL